MKKKKCFLIISLMIFIAACGKEKPQMNLQKESVETSAGTESLSEEYTEVTESEVHLTEEKAFEIPEGAVSLTEEEINWFNTEFFNNEERGYIENQFLISFYDEPSEIDLYELFYNGIDDSTRIAQEEKNTIIKQIPDARYLGIQKATETNITEILSYYMDISLENSQKIGLDKFLYLSDYNAYYLVHSDTNLMICEIENGYRTEDGEIVLLYSNDIISSEPWQGVVTLRTTSNSENSNYLFCANRSTFYEFPLVCLDFNGNYIEIPEIRWYIWLQEETGAIPLSLESMPQNTEALHAILKNCVAEVIKVPKELSPLYGMTISCIKGATYYGEDKENYYFCGTYPSGLRLAAPTQEYVGNTEVIRETLPDKWPTVKEQEMYINAIGKAVVHYESQLNSVAYDPYNLYAVQHYLNAPSDYRATIRDGFWVECVQYARGELLNCPEKYKYPEEILTVLYTKNNLPDDVLLCVTDETEVIDARAQIYAWYKIKGSDISLNDIIVLEGICVGKEERLIFAWNCLEEEWFTNYSKNFYVDITPSLKYFADHFVKEQ